MGRNNAITMLLAGFFVGRGKPSGVKEETAVAANRWELLAAPLDAAWLQRARRSGGAEPLHEAIYRQAPLSEQSWAQLQAHPQFVIGQALTVAEPRPPARQNPRR